MSGILGPRILLFRSSDLKPSEQDTEVDLVKDSDTFNISLKCVHLKYVIEKGKTIFTSVLHIELMFHVRINVVHDSKVPLELPIF